MLVNPRATYAHELAQKCFPPLNLLYLGAALRAEGFWPTVLDANALRLSDAEVAAAARQLDPLVVGLSVTSDILRHARDLSVALADACPDARLVLGGPHATAVPEQTLEQLGRADFVLRGEAERSLPALCRNLARGEDAGEVPGIYLRQGGSVRAGPPPQASELDALPLPARDLVADVYRRRLYHTLMVRRRPVDTLITSRGCPFGCGFCYTRGHRYRHRSADAVVDELARIRDLGIRDVEICDDTFTIHHGRAMEILDGIIRARLDLSFRIKSRTDVFDEALARRAKKAGAYLVAFGMESGSRRLLDAMAKGITPEHNARACRLTRRYGMLSHSSWIIGYPGETPQTLHETVTFIRQNRPHTVNVGVLRPYPGTPVYEEARQRGDLMGDWHPDAEAPWVRLPWATTREALKEAQRRFMRQVYVSPHYALSLGAEMVRNANWPMARYAAQELGKLVGRSR